MNYDSVLVTHMHLHFSKILSLCREFADFREHEQGGDYSRTISMLSRTGDSK